MTRQLTLSPDSHNRTGVKGGRRTDSAALFVSIDRFFEDLTHEAHFSAEQSRARSPSRLSPSHVDRKRPCDLERASWTRSQETLRLSGTDGDGAAMQPYAIMKKRADFLAANRGKRYATPGFVLLVRDRADDSPAIRLGITITKKVGNSVIRNRMRRRFRELAREMLAAKGKPGADHVLIGREGGIERDYGQLREELAKALDRLCGNDRSAEPVEARLAVKRPSTSSGLRTEE